jgi:hypothetical protein
VGAFEPSLNTEESWCRGWFELKNDMTAGLIGCVHRSHILASGEVTIGTQRAAEQLVTLSWSLFPFPED